MGSFAYIGVTFFFMTSAYGLKVGAKKNPDSTKVFWRRRLPKLLIPMFLVNVLTMVMHLIECKDISPGIAENNRNIQQYFSNGTKAQKWIVEKKENGYVIMSALNSDYVIDLSGGIISEGRKI